MLVGGNSISGHSLGKFALLAQKIAQHGINQGAEAPLGHLTGGCNGLVNHGMRRIRPGFQTIDRDQQQGADFLRTQRLAEQAGEEEITASVLAQAAINQVLHGRTGLRIDAAEQAVGQALPGKNGGIDEGGLLQGKSQGVEGQFRHSP